MKSDSLPRILLVDDHAAVRHGFALVLEQDGVGRCLEAATAEEALAAATSEPPDAALVDLLANSEAAMALIRTLSERHVSVLVCSMHEEPSYVRRALAAGARGYLTKREAPQDLARAVRDTLSGWLLISPRAAAALLGTELGPAATPPPARKVRSRENAD